VRKFGVQNALEVGTLIGYSAVLIARNLPEDGKLVTLEINPASARLATENIVRAGLEKKIEVIVGNALDIIPTLRTGYDMVFIDAAKNEYRDYLRLSEGYLKKGGVVFADNVKVFATSMQDFLDYLRNSGKYTSRTIDVGYDAVEIAIKLN
jgi:predicted O-methyltransferase YrrM